jgi:isoquinoline 1-oxidoreductase
MKSEQAGTASALSRRAFVGVLGAGLLIAVVADEVSGQEAGGRGGNRGGRGPGGNAPVPVANRIHIGRDGTITVLTGKVEGGQGARAELTQAAAEELGVPVERVKLVMADTAVVPDDGITAGSRTTPSTVPAVRKGAAAARGMLVALAARKWGVSEETLEVRDGEIANPATGGKVGYADLASDDEAARAMREMPAGEVAVTAVERWDVMGKTTRRPNARDIVIGRHAYPSDVVRDGMVYGKVLRAPTYRGQLVSVEKDGVKKIDGVRVVEDGKFVGVVGTTSHAAQKAIDVLAKAAKWEDRPHPSSNELFTYLRQNAKGVQPNPFAGELGAASKRFNETYHVPYVQHAPMEPRAAVAEWADGKLTVWTATQNPFGVRRELAQAFQVPAEDVRVIVPDFGGGFGGKHTGECAVEAARLARGAGKPVKLPWTRAEEFTWAVFRPAGVIDIEAGLDEKGTITSWYHVNINSGPASIETPYRIGKAKSQSVPSEPVLRHGSYRGLAATANTFAREVAMDELADLAGVGPLEFRRAHLDNDRLRAVLDAAAEKFGWASASKEKSAGKGVGLACSVDKGSVVATCVEVEIAGDTLRVRRVCQAYECGAIVNPDNLLQQVQGGIVMGLGPALREAIVFEGGKVKNASFWKYEVPRFTDLPKVDVVLIDRKDLPSVGAGETPLIAVSAAIANAAYRVTGVRGRAMPVKVV